MEREFDIIVFGASGFTGELVVEEIAKNTHQENLTWAVAGRNRHKIQQILVEVQNRLDTDQDLKNVRIFEADVTERSSLELMCQNTKLLMNCVGPYAKYGEAVIESCLKCGTHLVDMAVEISYLNHIILKYHQEAESRGIYIINSCGVAYLFIEMAVQVLQQKFNDGIDRIDVFIKPDLKFRSIHFATWNSYVNMTSGVVNLLVSRQKVYSEIMKKAKSNYSILALSCPLKFSREAKGVNFLYPAILHTADLGLDMKEAAFKEKPVKVHYYWTLDSPKMLLVYCFVTFFMMCLMPFCPGRWLLTKYAGFFSCGLVKKPTEIDETVDTATLNFTAVATGWSQNQQQNQKVERKIVLSGSGPTVYKNSAICLMHSALTVLQETDRLPNRGGIYMPLAAFAKTSLPSRLQNYGIKYEEKGKELVL